MTSSVPLTYIKTHQNTIDKLMFINQYFSNICTSFDYATFKIIGDLTHVLSNRVHYPEDNNLNLDIALFSKSLNEMVDSFLQSCISSLCTQRLELKDKKYNERVIDSVLKATSVGEYRNVLFEMYLDSRKFKYIEKVLKPVFDEHPATKLIVDKPKLGMQ